MKKRNPKLVVVGDRILIEPDEGEEKTAVGLYVPRWVVEKESVQGGRVIATGPGTPFPDFKEVDDGRGALPVAARATCRCKPALVITPFFCAKPRWN